MDSSKPFSGGLGKSFGSRPGAGFGGGGSSGAKPTFGSGGSWCGGSGRGDSGKPDGTSGFGGVASGGSGEADFGKSDGTRGFGRGFGSGASWCGGSGGGDFGKSGGTGGFGGGTFGKGDSKGGGVGFGGGSGCRKCGQDGHFARECPNAPSNDGKCRRCGEEGHYSRDCPSKPADAGKCRRCGEEGHMVRDCPRPMVCYRCGEEGHMGKECTNPPKPREDGSERPEAVTYVPVNEDAGALFCQHIPAGLNFDRYYDIPVQKTGADVPPHSASFDDMGLSAQLLENVAKSGAHPAARRAHHHGPARPHGLRPDRIRQNHTAGHSVVVYGGVAVNYQKSQVDKGCSLLVGTPGRLLHFINEGWVGLDRIKFLVLDEADRMLDMGFEPDVRRLVGHRGMPSKEEGRRTLMFSATFPETVQQLAREFLRDSFILVAVGRIGGANHDIAQHLYQVARFDKKDKLLELLVDVDKNKTEEGVYQQKTLVFVERKRTADTVAAILSQNDLRATSIHGDRKQEQREEALQEFKRGRSPVLVATSVAARVLDIVGVHHVINYDMPDSIDQYVHRIGRTGRVGNPGRATSFFDPENDAPLARDLLQILKDAQQEVPDWFLDICGERDGTRASDREDWGDGGAVGFGAKAAPEEEEW